MHPLIGLIPCPIKQIIKGGHTISSSCRHHPADLSLDWQIDFAEMLSYMSAATNYGFMAVAGAIAGNRDLYKYNCLIPAIKDPSNPKNYNSYG
ncbi:MAG: hypothetical protein IT292_07945 [Deltaproteobacteria bacterium]|nr:hypothetical protein [Deltaproteobacteria bacterium]